MIPQEGDIGTMNRAAHIKAAGHGNANLGRQGHSLEMVKKVIHNGFHHTGSICCRCMAMDVTLGMNDIGDAGAGPADGKFVTSGDMLTALKVFFQSFHFALAVHHELDVVPRGEPHESVAVFVGDFTELAHVFNGHEPATATPNGENLVACFRHMHQNPGLQDFVVIPFAVIVLNNRGKILPEMPRTQVRQPVFHGFFRII